MPHINSVGSVCHGKGGGSVNIDNVAKFSGAAFGWLDDGRVACASGVPADLLPGDNWQAMIYTVATNSRAPGTAPVQWATTGFAGGGSAAWWPPLRSSSGLSLPAAGLLGMGPDGAIGYKPNYNASGPTRVRELLGADYLLTPNHAYDLRLLGGRRAIWSDTGTGLTVFGIPMPSLLPGGGYFVYAFPIDGAWWVGYQSPTYGTLMHPFTDPNTAHVLVAAGVNAWPVWRALTNNSVRFAWANSEAEQAGQVTITTITIAGVPAGPIIDPGGGGTVPPTPPIDGGATGPRARVAPRPAVRHQYPHVDGIADWRAQQTTRLLWDRVFDLEERLQSTEATTGDLVGISNSQDDHLTVLAASALGTESLVQIAHGTGGSAGGGGGAVPSNIPQPPDLSAALADVLARLRADGETVDGDIIERGKVLRQFAWEHRADTPYGFGLLAKSGGNAWEGCSTDWLCYGYATDFIMADVVSTSGPLTTTGWGRFQLHFPQDEWVSVTSNPGYL